MNKNKNNKTILQKKIIKKKSKKIQNKIYVQEKAELVFTLTQIYNTKHTKRNITKIISESLPNLFSGRKY